MSLSFSYPIFSLYLFIYFFLYLVPASFLYLLFLVIVTMKKIHKELVILKIKQTQVGNKKVKIKQNRLKKHEANISNHVSKMDHLRLCNRQKRNNYIYAVIISSRKPKNALICFYMLQQQQK